MDFFHFFTDQSIPMPEKIVRTVAVYALLLVIFRIVGKRGLAAMNTFDIVVMLLLANVVQNAIIGNDNSLRGGIVGAVTLVAVNAITNRAGIHWPKVRQVLEGTQREVISDGKIIQGVPERLGIQVDDLDHAVRLQSGNAIADVKHGVLEPNGQFILTLKRSERGSTHSDIEEILARLRHIENLLKQ